MKIDEKKRSLPELKRIFKNSILPLLVEYFYDDLGRVGLVLGKSFVGKKENSVKLAKFAHDQRDDLEDRSVWILEDIDKLSAADFKSIYE
jgi:5-methylcytosine-specific restriction protein B